MVTHDNCKSILLFRNQFEMKKKKRFKWENSSELKFFPKYFDVQELNEF